VPTSAEAVYYTVPSGAGIIDLGTQWWPCALRRHCTALPARDNTFARQVMTNILHAFATGPAGRTHPAHDNTTHFHLPPTDTIPSQ
jgi:hypothetical protein